MLLTQLGLVILRKVSGKVKVFCNLKKGIPAAGAYFKAADFAAR